MARRSQCSSAGDNPLDPNYLPPHYREEYRLAIDALIEEDLEGYYQFLQKADVVDFLSPPEIQYIQNSVQAPQQHNPDQYFNDTVGDGSSDTYWPVHSDLDAPDLDLGWPQLHPFIGPTEVTTLVNPPEPDMPSIKEQARRLIKNAQQVIAIVMDMFTDVDMFADILDAAMRNVVVYILLDKQNVHHFITMVSNCRVNLQSIQLLRVRTVSGITYHCRSGKTFNGQMMDRFLLTDCRAVLSGNYSFMWSFEKLHRCMAHLFLGQLVSTFDEEFRILFAQSEPLIIENYGPMEEFGLSQKRQYPSERKQYREPKKFQPPDAAYLEEWPRHSFDERMDPDWRMMAIKKQEHMHGPADMYNRFTPQQPRIDPAFDHGPSRMPMMENLPFKRHSRVEGAHSRYPYPFLQQQAMPEPDNQGRYLHRPHQPGPGKEADGYDKFWNQDFYLADQYSDPGFPQEMEPTDTFDPVLNYLSSTQNADFDQASEKLLPPSDLPFGSSQPRRLSLGNVHASQTSPIPSNPTDQKQYLQETDRKDPMVKRGLRNWRISSYLSAYDNPGDEGLSLAPPNAPDAFEDSSNPMKPAPGIDLSVPKIPNVREFKVPAVPRASQIPSYAKTAAREQPKKIPDEPAAVAAEMTTTPTPSESSSTTEVEKIEEGEQTEPKTAILRREESFRRKYNAAVPRSSRLRSSLIFSSLDQQLTSQDTKPALGQQDEESEKNESEQTKLPFVSQFLGQRRSTAREPFEWSRYMKSATFDNSSTDPPKPEDENRKPDDKDPPMVDNSKDLSTVEESSKPTGAEQAESSPSMPPSKDSEAELPETDQPKQPRKPLPITPFVDMNDPDSRLTFFKELAAKRKAAKAAEAEKSKAKASMKPPTEPQINTTVKKEELVSNEPSKKVNDTSTSEGLLEKNATAEVAEKTESTEACEPASLSLDVSDKTKIQDSQVQTDPSTSQSSKQEQTRVSSDSEKPDNYQLAATDSAETEVPQIEPPEEQNTAVQRSNSIHPPTPTNAIPVGVPSLAHSTDESERLCLTSTSEESSSATPSSVEIPLSSACAQLDSNTKNPDSVQSDISISSPPLLPAGSDSSSPNPLHQSSDHILPDSDKQTNPNPSPTSSAPLSSPVETTSSHGVPEDSSSTLTSNILPPNAQESDSPSQPDLTSSEPLSVADSARVESVSCDKCAAGSDTNTLLSQSSTKTDSEETCAPTPSEKDVPESENNSVPKDVGEELDVLGSSKDVKADSPLPNLRPLPCEPCLPSVTDIEIKSSETPTISSSDTPCASQSEKQVIPPSNLNLTGSATPTSAEAVSCSSPPTESVGSVLSPEAVKALAESHSNSSTENTEMSSPNLPTSEFPTEPDLQCKTPVMPEAHLPEPLVPAENSNVDNRNEVSKEIEMPGENKSDDVEGTNKESETTKTNEQDGQNNCSEPQEIKSNEVIPPFTQAKQPKSRYQSSTANVLSSSNLRDDTKLLLEQISAQSQSRNDAAKESPVTDDEKEDKADKNSKREKERGIRSLSRDQYKPSQEREKLLERIQSMRKERKVYSRFEMAP